MLGLTVNKQCEFMNTLGSTFEKDLCGMGTGAPCFITSDDVSPTVVIYQALLAH